VGDGTVIREFATINIGTAETGETVIGRNCLLMAYSHVAHDCRLGDHVILANAATLAGHIVLEDWVTIGGLTPIHQFVRIGQYAFIGGASRVIMDVIPYGLAAGTPLKMAGLNMVGLKRHGFDKDTIDALKQAYKIIFRSKLTLKNALRKVEEEIPGVPEVANIVKFISGSKRGISR